MDAPACRATGERGSICEEVHRGIFEQGSRGLGHVVLRFLPRGETLDISKDAKRSESGLPAKSCRSPEHDPGGPHRGQQKRGRGSRTGLKTSIPRRSRGGSLLGLLRGRYSGPPVVERPKWSQSFRPSSCSERDDIGAVGLH